jgi:hypothetical protein
MVVLCEGDMDERFARRLLQSRNVGSRQVRVEKTQWGSGEQFVRERYPVEVRAYRSQQRQNVGLLVLTDADEMTVDQRRRTLDMALEQSGQTRREAAERIALMLPKRNMETWVWHLCGNVVDEETEYKPRPLPADGSSAGRGALQHLQQAPGDCCPPSLAAGGGEFNKLGL